LTEALLIQKVSIPPWAYYKRKEIKVNKNDIPDLYIDYTEEN